MLKLIQLSVLLSMLILLCIHENNAQMSSGLPLQVEIAIPQPGDIVGKSGLGWNLDVNLASMEGNASVLSSSYNYTTGYNPPGGPHFKPGQSYYAPGLVVLCNNTPITSAGLSGPDTNLAGLFQVNAVSGTFSANIYSALRYGWQVGSTAFGVDIETNCTAFVVNGTAPDIYLSNNSSHIISNIAAVKFRIAGNSTGNISVAAPDVPSYTTSILSPSKGDITGASGANWLVDLLINSNASNAFTLNNATLPLLSSPNSSTFKVGPSAAVPGLVVLLNTTSQTVAPFMGPMTNLAGLFQINAVTGNNATTGTISQVQLMWQVGKAFTIPNVTALLSVYMVNGSAPTVVDPSTVALTGSQSNVTFDISSA